MKLIFVKASNKASLKNNLLGRELRLALHHSTPHEVINDALLYDRVIDADPLWWGISIFGLIGIGFSDCVQWMMRYLLREGA